MSVLYNSNTWIEKNFNVIYRQIDGKQYLLNFKSGNILEINNIARFIWNSLPNQLSNIISKVSTEFKIPKQRAERDVIKFLNFLGEYDSGFIVKTLCKQERQFPRNIIGDISLNRIEQFGVQECIPIIAKIELLYDCNLRCIHCYTITERYRRNALKTSEMKFIIDQLYEIGTILVSFTGGEIFLREDLWNLIDYSDRKGFLIELLTNGTLITEKYIEKLKSYRIYNIQISLYSHKPDVHDAVTGIKGSHAKTLRAIRLLTKNNFNVEIVTPLMKINFVDLKEVQKLAVQMGAKHYYVYPIFERYNNSKDVYNLRISKNQILQFFIENPKEILFNKRETTQPICEAGTNQCSISPFGDVFPCFHNMLPIKLGNLLKQSLKDIWNTSAFLKKFRNLTIGSLDKCSRCPAMPYCRICPGLNMKANNNILEPASICCDYAFSAKEVIESIYLNAKNAD